MERLSLYITYYVVFDYKIMTSFYICTRYTGFVSFFHLLACLYFCYLLLQKLPNHYF